MAGCGGGAGGPSAPGDREWKANAAGLIEQLRNDVVVTWDGGDDLATARAALRNESDVYALLLAYSDFGGCRHMLGDVGAATERFSRVERALAGACGHLERASALFTRATSATDPQALLAASREAQKASPLLVRAAFELAAVSAR